MRACLEEMHNELSCKATQTWKSNRRAFEQKRVRIEEEKPEDSNPLLYYIATDDVVVRLRAKRVHVEEETPGDTNPLLCHIATDDVVERLRAKEVLVEEKKIKMAQWNMQRLRMTHPRIG